MTIANRVGRTTRPAASAEDVGRSSPLGATVVEGGVNFCLYSRSAARVELVFFDREDDARPSHVVQIDPVTRRSYHYWHVFVPRAAAGQIYGYRVDGSSDPARGLSDIVPWQSATAVPGHSYRAGARSVVMLFATDPSEGWVDRENET